MLARAESEGVAYGKRATVIQAKLHTKIVHVLLM